MKDNKVLKKYVTSSNRGSFLGGLTTYEFASILMRQMKKFGFDKREVKAIEDVMSVAFNNSESVKEEVEVDLDEKNMSSGDMIKKLFKLRKDKEVAGVANLLNMTDAKVLQKMQKDNPKGFARMAAKMGELPAMEEVEVQESVEKTTEKLVERNMLGRLAKQLQLNEEGKNKMFAYFEKGELKQ